MSQWRLSPRAERDLEQIWDYSVAQWGSEQAERYEDAIYAKLDALVSGETRVPSANGVQREIFRVLIGSHNLLIHWADDILIVTRILHERMDIRRHLK